MAVPANTTNPLEQRYLFDFFNKLRLNQSNKYNSYTEGLIKSRLLDSTRNVFADTLLIQDGASKMALSNGGIFRRRIGGSIGARGSYASDIGTKTETIKVTVLSGDTENVYDQIFSISSHYYRKQVSDSMYDEIEVINLRATFKVYEQYESIGDDTDDILIIPIDRTITQAYSTTIKNELYSRSLHYVFNSRVISYTYFYQSGLFQFVIIAIALAMAIYSVGQSLYVAAVLLELGVTISVILITMLVNILETIIISLALAYIAKKVGPGVAIALALLAAAYGLGGQGFAGLPTLPFADTLLNVSLSIVKAVGEFYTAEITEIQNSFNELSVESSKVSELINKAQDLLADNMLLSPLTIIGESADDYYRRTMYSGDVGAIAIGSINNFYERALTLPTLADSFGDVLS